LFRLPSRSEINGATAITLDEEELNALLDGIDLEKPVRRVKHNEVVRLKKPLLKFN